MDGWIWMVCSGDDSNISGSRVVINAAPLKFDGARCLWDNEKTRVVTVGRSWK